MSHYCPSGTLTGLRGQKVVLRLGSNENLSRSSKQSPVKLQTKSDQERSGSVSSNSLRFITRSSYYRFDLKRSAERFRRYRSYKDFTKSQFTRRLLTKSRLISILFLSQH